MTFDRQAFLDWLDERDGPVPLTDIQREWPHFPTENLRGVTMVYDSTGTAVYQRDLRRAAKGRGPVD